MSSLPTSWNSPAASTSAAWPSIPHGADGASAREKGHGRLSRPVFSENKRALVWYEREGFREIDRRPIILHPLFRYAAGDIILMAREV
ncbi:MAG: hypothetical protein V3V17_05815 [Alphaproteobacteria bacterium]